MFKSLVTANLGWQALLALVLPLAAINARSAETMDRTSCEVTRTVFEPLWLGMSEDAARAAIGPALRRTEYDNTYEVKQFSIMGLTGTLTLRFFRGALDTIQVRQRVSGTIEGQQLFESARGALGLPPVAGLPNLGEDRKCWSARSSRDSGSDRRLRFELQGEGVFIDAWAYRNAIGSPPVERPTIEPPPFAQQQAAVATYPPGPYGPSVGGLRLGMTEADARRILGSAMTLFERYRTFTVFDVQKYEFLGSTGRLRLQFDEGRGLTKLSQTWTLPDLSRSSQLIGSAVAWTEIEPEKADLLRRKLRSDEARAKRMASQTHDQVLRDAEAGRKHPGEEDLDYVDAKRVSNDDVRTVYVLVLVPGEFITTLDLTSVRWTPQRAAKGEDPLRDWLSEAEEAFEASMQRAAVSRGFLSPYHGVYARVCPRAPAAGFLEFNRAFARMERALRLLIWSEGDRVFVHGGRGTAAVERVILARRGSDEIVFVSDDGSKEKVKVFMLDVDEKLESGQKTRWLFADGRMLVVNGEELKGLITLRVCERP